MGRRYDSVLRFSIIHHIRECGITYERTVRIRIIEVVSQGRILCCKQSPHHP